MSAFQESSSSIYEYLQSQVSQENKLIVRKADNETRHGSIYHAVDGSGHPTLLIQIDPSSRQTVEWENRLVSLAIRTIRVEGEQENFLTLQCLSERVRSQFGHIVDDILESLESDLDDPAAVTRQTLDRWRELLRDERPRILGQVSLTGLYGELYFLEQLVFHHGPSALSTWTGPFGNRHDFEFKGKSVEVKTTTGSNTMSVTFHGARQLEYAEDGELYIHVYQIERHPAGTSVPALLERLFSSGVNRVDLFHMLEMAGYYDQDAIHYATVRFNAIGTKTVIVDSSFPRITRETMVDPELLDGIAHLQYAVDIGPLSSHDLSFEELGACI
ncbi:PD-(D/E)XK motif protein [Arthrobacter koreensis]|uniref:PD-(D/E)XK motif protein n=1 Tax=Arthrobacter koreensis TaxID=199136 RepID=UPI003638DAF6